MDSLLTIFVSGVFGLLVAVVTSVLSRRAEHDLTERTRRTRKYEEIHTLYVDLLATLEQCVRLTERCESYDDVIRDLPRTNARLRLGTSDAVLRQLESVSAVMYQWSTEFRHGAPKKLGDFGMAIISSADSKHSEAARLLFPQFEQEHNKLVEAMRDHLKSIQP